jgi:hypothetical protein
MRYLVLILALLCAPAYAQIDVEASYPAYTTFKIDVTVPKEHDFRSVHWTFTPARISAQEGANGELYATGVPGVKYTVVCDVVSGKLNPDGTATIDRKDHKRYESAFTIERGNDDDGNDPGPSPDPGPGPTPQPVVENATVLLVEETALRTVEHVKVINDVAFWASITNRGMTWRLYDKDGPGLAANLKDAAVRVGLPAVVIHDKGRVLSAIPLPKTSAEIDVEIKRVTGK